MYENEINVVIRTINSKRLVIRKKSMLETRIEDQKRNHPNEYVPRSLYSEKGNITKKINIIDKKINKQISELRKNPHLHGVCNNLLYESGKVDFLSFLPEHNGWNQY